MTDLMAGNWIPLHYSFLRILKMHQQTNLIKNIHFFLAIMICFKYVQYSIVTKKTWHATFVFKCGSTQFYFLKLVLDVKMESILPAKNLNDGKKLSLIHPCKPYFPEQA